MNITEAIEQINTIHEHEARGESYRGYHPGALAASGGLGLLAGALQGWILPEMTPTTFVLYWTAVASLAFVVGAWPTVMDYLTRDDALARRRTRTITWQFLPCLVVGFILTLAVVRHDPAHAFIALLPGCWCLLFGLGTVASRPFLPVGAGGVAIWFFLAGSLLLLCNPGSPPPGWAVGIPFGFGQILAAGVLLRDRREGRSDGV